MSKTIENTLENKEKFFALYWGQNVRFWTFNGSDVLGKVGHTYMTKAILESCTLELKPLSSISDEDAEYCIGRSECLLRKNNINHGDYGMSPSAIFVNSLIGDNSYHIDRREADYLRSKGYAIKWMDIDVKDQISYSWIKLKED